MKSYSKFLSEGRGFSKETNQQMQAKRIEKQIAKRYAKGESPKTNKQLAQMMDNLYGTTFVKRYHTK